MATKKKKRIEVGPYEVYLGKDKDGEPGWLIHENDEPYDGVAHEDEEDAVSAAEELWAEQLKEEITSELPDDVVELQKILAFVRDEPAK